MGLVRIPSNEGAIGQNSLKRGLDHEGLMKILSKEDRIDGIGRNSFK